MPDSGWTSGAAGGDLDEEWTSEGKGYAATMFRVLNERIRLLVLPFQATLDEREPVPFVCECRVKHCFAPVEITLREYEAIRMSDEHRLVAPGHEVEGEQVVVQTPTYAVVRPAEVGESAWERHRA